MAAEVISMQNMVSEVISMQNLWRYFAGEAWAKCDR
jgi:hypothetical protein